MVAAKFIKPLYRLAKFGACYPCFRQTIRLVAKSPENGVLCFAIAIESALQPGRLQRLTSSPLATPRSETAHPSQVTPVSDFMGEAAG